MPLFEVVVLEKPSEEDERKGRMERVVWGPEHVIASDTQNACIQIFMENDIKVVNSRMQVLCRPF